MGRIGEGDWLDEHGRRLSINEIGEIATRSPATPARFPSTASRKYRSAINIEPAPEELPSRIVSDLDHLAHNLMTAADLVGRGWESVSITLPGRHAGIGLDEFRSDAPRINAALREAVVANALLQRPTSPHEIATIIKKTLETPAGGAADGRSRIHDMLLEAASNGATPEQRLHAKGLLAVYEMERGDAAARGDLDPAEHADAAINRFIGDQLGEIPWAVYDPEQDADEIEPVGDEGEPKKPRGMHHPETRAAAERGKRRHEITHEVFRERGWKADKSIPGTRLRPDGITEKGKPVEVKPDTESGRKSREKQIQKYNEATGKRGRVIYYSHDGSYYGFRGGLGGPPRGGSGPGPFSK